MQYFSPEGEFFVGDCMFCGVYVDGDRERIPYEGDAYINQLGHYCVDREYVFARYSHE